MVQVANPNPLQCYDASLFHAYRRHILESFQLLDVSPPPIPTVTLIMRHRSAHVIFLFNFTLPSFVMVEV